VYTNTTASSASFCQFIETIGLRLNWAHLLMGTMANFGQKKRTEGGHGMTDTLTRLYVKLREGPRGQTMAEYALIMSAVAVVVFVAYRKMGTTVTTLLGTVDNDL
jgi:Flp pilus assembly pilin Flp